MLPKKVLGFTVETGITMQNIRTFKDIVTTDEVATSPRTPDPTLNEIRQLTAEIRSG